MRTEAFSDKVFLLNEMYYDKSWLVIMRFDDENSHEQYCHHFSMNRYSRHTTVVFELLVLKMDLLYDMAKVLVTHWIIQLCKVEWRNSLFPISIQIISPPLHH